MSAEVRMLTSQLQSVLSASTKLINSNYLQQRIASKAVVGFSSYVLPPMLLVLYLNSGHILQMTPLGLPSHGIDIILEYEAGVILYCSSCQHEKTKTNNVSV